VIVLPTITRFFISSFILTPSSFQKMLAWQTTRNTYEAAALASLDIALKPVPMQDHKTGQQYTDWHLASVSSVDPERNGRAFITGVLRRDFNGGKLIGELATQLLHPYLIALRTMVNRTRLIESHKGASYRLIEEAPGSYLLQASKEAIVARSTEVTFQSQDQDLILALIGIGHDLLDVAHNGTGHTYTVARFARPLTTEPNAPRTDCEPLITALRSNTLFAARRWEPFAIAIHALHCLRELRKHQQSDQWITVSHKTFRDKGAAFRADAPGHTIDQVQRRLGIKIS